jgi:hypothetical protein
MASLCWVQRAKYIKPTQSQGTQNAIQVPQVGLRQSGCFRKAGRSLKRHAGSVWTFPTAARFRGPRPGADRNGSGRRLFSCVGIAARRAVGHIGDETGAAPNPGADDIGASASCRWDVSRTRKRSLMRAPQGRRAIFALSKLTSSSSGQQKRRPDSTARATIKAKLAPQQQPPCQSCTPEAR